LQFVEVKKKVLRGNEMPKLPKLKVKKPFGYPSEEIRDFEQAKYFLFSYGASTIVMVEKQVVNSYDELLQLAAQDCYKDKESLDVVVLPAIVGGG